MEHISRQTARDVNILLLISEPTIRGITAAARMKQLIGELRTNVGSIVLVLNRVRNGIPKEIEKAIKQSGLKLASTIPEDPNMAELEIKGAPLTELPPDSPLRNGVIDLAKKLGLV
jgi:CO dehydrogenase maturation factor